MFLCSSSHLWQRLGLIVLAFFALVGGTLGVIYLSPLLGLVALVAVSHLTYLASTPSDPPPR